MWTSVGVLTNLSPLGEVTLPSSLTPADPAIDLSQETTVTAAITNPNPNVQGLSSVTVELPTNVDYVPGSNVGIDEPTLSSDGRTLTHEGASEIASEEQFDFTFKVTGNQVGSADLTLEATTTGGAPVVPSSTIITVDAIEAVLESPTFTQATCAAEGAVAVGPTVELPADTDLVTHTLVGEVIAGGDDTDGGTSTDTDLAQTGVGVAIVVASRERSA